MSMHEMSQQNKSILEYIGDVWGVHPILLWVMSSDIESITKNDDTTAYIQCFTSDATSQEILDDLYAPDFIYQYFRWLLNEQILL